MLNCETYECYFNHEGICCFEEIDYVENEEPEIIEDECNLIEV